MKAGAMLKTESQRHFKIYANWISNPVSQLVSQTVKRSSPCSPKAKQKNCVYCENGLKQICNNVYRSLLIHAFKELFLLRFFSSPLSLSLSLPFHSVTDERERKKCMKELRDLDMPQVTFIAIPASQKTKPNTSNTIQYRIVSYYTYCIVHSWMLWKLTCCAENKPERINRQRRKNTRSERKKEKKLIKTNELMFHACSFLALNENHTHSLNRSVVVLDFAPLFCQSPFQRTAAKHFTTFLNWFIRAEKNFVRLFKYTCARFAFICVIWIASVEQLGSFSLHSRKHWNNVAVCRNEKNEHSVRMRVELHWSMYLTLLLQFQTWWFHEWFSRHITYTKHHSFFALIFIQIMQTQQFFDCAWNLFEPLESHLHWGIYSFEACCHKT